MEAGNLDGGAFAHRGGVWLTSSGASAALSGRLGPLPMRRKKLAPLVFIVLTAAIALGAVPGHGHLAPARASTSRAAWRWCSSPPRRPATRRSTRRSRSSATASTRSASPSRRSPARATRSSCSCPASTSSSGPSTWSAPPPSCGSGPCCSQLGRPRTSTPPPRPRATAPPPRPRRTTTTTTAAGDDHDDGRRSRARARRPPRSRTAARPPRPRPHHDDDGDHDHHDRAGEPAPARAHPPRGGPARGHRSCSPSSTTTARSSAVYQLGPSQATGEIVADADAELNPTRPVDVSPRDEGRRRRHRPVQRHRRPVQPAVARPAPPASSPSSSTRSCSPRPRSRQPSFEQGRHHDHRQLHRVGGEGPRPGPALRQPAGHPRAADRADGVAHPRRGLPARRAWPPACSASRSSAST